MNFGFPPSFLRALERLKHYARITGSNREVVDLYVQEFHRPDQALKASDGDAPGLEHLAELLARQNDDPSIIAVAKQKAGDLRLERATHSEADFGDVTVAARVAIRGTGRGAAELRK